MLSAAAPGLLTCGHAFVPLLPQLLADDSVSLGQLDEGAQRQLALVGQQQKVGVVWREGPARGEHSFTLERVCLSL